MKFLLTLLSILFLYSLNAQNRATIANFRADKAICKEFAKRAIVELENGELLVRLDFRKREVDYYRSKGNTKEADKVEAEQLKKNRFIVNAFKENYTFSSVHFFALYDSKHIVSGQFDSVTFYTTSFEIDSVFKPVKNAYLIAEFARTRQDTMIITTTTFPIPHEKIQNKKAIMAEAKTPRMRSL